MHALAVLLSAFVLPGFTNAATEPSGGQLLEGTFPGTARPGYVYLPPSSARPRYHVVYLPWNAGIAFEYKPGRSSERSPMRGSLPGRCTRSSRSRPGEDPLRQ